MKKLQTCFKALSRMNAFLLLLLCGPVLMAQETTVKADTAITGTTTEWYDQGWIWFVIIIVAIILILAFIRKSDKGTIGSNKYKDKY